MPKGIYSLASRKNMYPLGTVVQAKQKIFKRNIINHIYLQEANNSQHDWYKKVYNTIHKVSDGGELFEKLQLRF